MIRQSLKTDGISISTNDAGWRIVYDTDGNIKHRLKAKGHTRTYSKDTITEVPYDAVPEHTEPEQVRDEIAGLVLASELTDEEISAIMGLYDKWSDVEVGAKIKEDKLLVYKGVLYTTIKTHDKQNFWSPANADSLFTEAAPAGVIPVWKQPEGAHDAYVLGDKVQWPEGGAVWECTAVDDNGYNVWEPGVYGWTEI